MDGKIIRIPIPNFPRNAAGSCETVKHLAEECRVRVRACRRDAMDAAKKLQKAGELTEDELRDARAKFRSLLISMSLPWRST